VVHLVMSNMFHISKSLDILLHLLSHVRHADPPPTSPGLGGPGGETQRVAVGPTGLTVTDCWRNHAGENVAKAPRGRCAMSLLLIVAVAGAALLFGIAVTVGYMEAHQSAVWRDIAAQRRRRWEEEHGRSSDDE
jgi:hypothetical protein